MKDAVTKPILVLDTSVLVKWFVLEKEDKKQIERLKQDFYDRRFTVVLPAVIGWELNNYLGRTLSKSEAMKNFSFYKNLNFQEALLSVELSGLAFKIMQKCPGTAFYDASFHALALHLDGLYLTADERYFNKAKNFGRIELLKNYSA